MKKILFILPCLLMIIFTMSGCGKPDMNKKEIKSYLEKRYEKDFTYISSGYVSRSERKNMCDSINSETETVSDLNRCDKVDTYKDENDIEFHVFHYRVMGLSSCWNVTDDYCVQYLMSHPELYEQLKQPSFNCTQFNTIGTEENGSAGFKLYVSTFDDIRCISETAFDVISNDNAVLPGPGMNNDNSNARSVIPSVTLVTANGLDLGKLDFQTEYCPHVTDKENFIRSCENQLIEYVNNGEFETDISSELLNRKDPLYIPVYNGEKQIATMSCDSYRYYIKDGVGIGSRMEFLQLRALCEPAGYTMTAKGSELNIKKGSDVIHITRSDGKYENKSNFIITKNGKEFVLEGKLDDDRNQDECWLTISDYYYLFGIRITVDYENHTSYIS